MTQQLLERIAEGRESLAWGGGNRGRQAHSAVGALLHLLWHGDRAVRQIAVRSLPGGDRHNDYEAHYGYFSEALLRELRTRHTTPPDSPGERYIAVAEVLGALIGDSARDIKAMSGMQYSFLSSALYLALFATCRDSLFAAMRLRCADVHHSLCELLIQLETVAGTGRLNPADTLLLAESAGRALAVLSPSEIPAYWSHLTDGEPLRRRAMIPALKVFSDARATEPLASALPGQSTDVAVPIIGCLGRIGNESALPVLRRVRSEGGRTVARAAENAILAIAASERHRAGRTLLRACAERSAHLLRASAGFEAAPRETLVRPAAPEQERARP